MPNAHWWLGDSAFPLSALHGVNIALKAIGALLTRMMGYGIMRT